MPIKFWIAVVPLTCLVIWLLRLVDRRNSVQVYTPQDHEKHQALLKPYLRREIVECKVRSLFPNQDHAKILELLDTVPYSWDLERTQLDFLKVSNGSLDQLHHHIDIARSEGDSLEVIKLAEAPESTHRDIHDKDRFWGEHKKAIERDFRQYLNWLKKK